MAFTIASNVGSSMAAATGRSTQGHLCYAVNQGAWWCFYLTGTQVLSAAYSTNNGTSWTAPTGSPFSLIAAHNSEGRSFGFGYANISSTDVLHMTAGYGHGFGQYHSRFTLGSTWSNTNSEASVFATPNDISGGSVALDTSNYPYDAFTYTNSDTASYPGTNVDTGSSWTAGFNSPDATNFASANPTSSANIRLASRNMIQIFDDAVTTGTFNNLTHNFWNGSIWASAFVLASNVTTTDCNAWGAVGRTTSDAHLLVLSNNSNTYTHQRFNGSSWSAGDTIGNLTYGTNSGISLVTDGASVWAGAIDSSKNIQYNKWTTLSGWTGWNVLESARTNTPAYITGAYSSNAGGIMWAWTESTGSNYNIIGSFLSLTAAAGSSSYWGRSVLLPWALTRLDQYPMMD
jgi:hypothetical protein